MTNNVSRFLATLLIGGMIFMSACNNDRLADIPPPDTRTIWTGPTIAFEKIVDSDPQAAANQDRITDAVWITRGNDGGEIFNARSEDSSDKGNSPAGTQWAMGTIDDIDNLSFRPFREAVGSPREVVGQDLVLFLTEEEIFIAVRFTDWTQGRGGGFAYERSTE